MKNLFFVLLLLVISSCTTVSESAKDMVYQLSGPRVSYTQNTVRVSYRESRAAPYRQGQAVYLMSNHHGVISSARFSLVRESASTRTVALMAELEMPRTVPATAEDTCFYIADSKDNNGRVLGVKEDIAEAGFKNDLWQLNIARGTQADHVERELAALDEDKKTLQMDYADAKAYLENSEIYNNGQCALPANNEPAPPKPHYELFDTDTQSMAYAVCHMASYKGMTGGNKGFFYTDAGSGKINRYLTEQSDFFDSVEYIVKQAEKNDIGNERLLAYSRYANAILNSGNSEADGCIANGRCTVYDQLYSGSPYRDYIPMFEKCAQDVAMMVAETSQRYKTAYQNWLTLPARQQQFCANQTDIFNSYAATLETLNEKHSQLVDSLNELKRYRATKASNKVWNMARENTCAI